MYVFYTFCLISVSGIRHNIPLGAVGQAFLESWKGNLSTSINSSNNTHTVTTTACKSSCCRCRCWGWPPGATIIIIIGDAVTVAMMVAQSTAQHSAAQQSEMLARNKEPHRACPATPHDLLDLNEFWVLYVVAASAAGVVVVVAAVASSPSLPYSFCVLIRRQLYMYKCASECMCLFVCVRVCVCPIRRK